jgi:cell division protein ZapA
MGQVNLTISGKTYRMACDDGQEEHLTGLAQRLSDTIATLRERFGEIGDQRLTVMAAITMADQYSESDRRLKQVETERANLEEGRSTFVEHQHEVEAGLAQTIEAVAARMEAIADRLIQAEHADEPG